MPLQVPLKTGKASETEMGRETESISLRKGVLENRNRKKVDEWMYARLCLCPQLVLLVSFWFLHSNFCEFLRKSKDVCFVYVLKMRCWSILSLAWSQRIIGLGGSICCPKENSLIYKTLLRTKQQTVV